MKNNRKKKDLEDRNRWYSGLHQKSVIRMFWLWPVKLKTKDWCRNRPITAWMWMLLPAQNSSAEPQTHFAAGPPGLCKEASKAKLTLRNSCLAFDSEALATPGLLISLCFIKHCHLLWQCLGNASNGHHAPGQSSNQQAAKSPDSPPRNRDGYSADHPQQRYGGSMRWKSRFK